jgi:uncharacterized protein
MKTMVIHSCHFSWFKDKALSNRQKHGLMFEAAAWVFLDPLASIRPDSGLSWEEERWVVLGMLQDKTLAVVVHVFTEVGDQSSVRIISARKATRRERVEYETGTCSVREPSPAVDYTMIKRDEDGMCEEYDFSNAVRGKYYRPNMIIGSFPIYLDEEVQTHFQSLARARGIETCELVNEVLRGHMPAQTAPPANRR